MRSIVIAILAAFLVLGASVRYVSGRRELAAQRDAIAAAWTPVSSALDRRAELIPALTRTFHGSAFHDAPVLQELAASAAALGAARTAGEKMRAYDRLSAALSRLLLLTERYPQLRAGADYQHLQDELARTENQVFVERRKYNEAVQKYNTAIGQFPNNIVAAIGGFARNDAYFRTEPDAR
ncbi:MAG: LemA family protein [Acidobacteriota bacterium]|nr:LemA family protein [Acidobacteriota bacterium]